MKGIKIHEGRIGKSPRSCLSITPSILHKPKKVWLCNDSSFNNTMLWASSATTFFSFCRSGEVTVQKEFNYDPTVHLSYGDLAVDNAANPSVTSIQQQFDTACNLISAPQCHRTPCSGLS